MSALEKWVNEFRSESMDLCDEDCDVEFCPPCARRKMLERITELEEDLVYEKDVGVCWRVEKYMEELKDQACDTCKKVFKRRNGD